jgi:hypothetical protein
MSVNNDDQVNNEIERDGTHEHVFNMEDGHLINSRIMAPRLPPPWDSDYELPCGLPLFENQIQVIRGLNGELNLPIMVRQRAHVIVSNLDMERMEDIEERLLILLDKTDDDDDPLDMKKICIYQLHRYMEDIDIDIDDMTLKHVSEFIMSQMQEYLIDGIPLDRRLAIIEHIFKIKPNTKINEILVINCHLCMECNPLNPTLPTIPELREFNRNQREMMGYLESEGGDSTYHDRQQVYIGLPSMKSFEDTLSETIDDDCMMCCYDLKEGQDVYKIPCGHTFHRNNQECQRNGSDEIAEWFKQHVRCPICQKDIREYVMMEQ